MLAQKLQKVKSLRQTFRQQLLQLRQVELKAGCAPTSDEHGKLPEVADPSDDSSVYTRSRDPAGVPTPAVTGASTTARRNAERLFEVSIVSSSLMI
jgi:hypothetical protein